MVGEINHIAYHGRFQNLTNCKTRCTYHIAPCIAQHVFHLLDLFPTPHLQYLRCQSRHELDVLWRTMKSSRRYHEYTSHSTPLGQLIPTNFAVPIIHVIRIHRSKQKPFSAHIAHTFPIGNEGGAVVHTFLFHAVI